MIKYSCFIFLLRVLYADKIRNKNTCSYNMLVSHSMFSFILYIYCFYYTFYLFINLLLCLKVWNKVGILMVAICICKENKTLLPKIDELGDFYNIVFNADNLIIKNIYFILSNMPNTSPLYQIINKSLQNKILIFTTFDGIRIFRSSINLTKRRSYSILGLNFNFILNRL